MKSLIRSLLLVALPGFIFAQTNVNRYAFEDYNKVKVIANGDSLINAWAGGMNWTQFNTFDLNHDNIDDLLIFDRAGNRLMPFLVETNNGNKRYKFAPQYIDSFPTIKYWMLLIDYNCDGRKDLFTSSPGGIGVYKNTGHLNWQWALSGINIKTDYGQGIKQNLYISTVDIPAIVDVDGDGDLDIFTFGQGNTVQHHEGKVNCGLDFDLKYFCWGGFEENGLTNVVELDKCNGLNPPPPPEIGQTDHTDKTTHSGSSILLIDLTGNNLYDAIIGDISFNTAIAVYNDGSSDSAHMYLQDTLFPKYDKPVDIEFYPGFFYEDVNFDGKKDLIVSPHIQGTENYNNTWFYKNTVSTANPTFSFQDSGIVQNQMIDMGEASRPVFMDLNYDQKTDLLLCNKGFYDNLNYVSKVYHYQNVGAFNNPEYKLVDTDFADLSTYNLGTDLHVTFADLDGDSDLDMLVGNIDGKIQYFENQGLIPNYDFVLKQANFQNIDVGANSTPFLYDVNNDGAPDLIIGNSEGLIYYYQNNKTTNLSFTLISDNFGGVDTKSIYTNLGYSTPIMFKDSGSAVLMVGSYDRGILQYDSIDHVLSLPSNLYATFDGGTTPSPDHKISTFGTTKKAGRNQLLFKASELQAKGLEYGKITDISIKTIGTGNPLLGYDGLVISMKMVNEDSLTTLHKNTVETYYSITSTTTGWLNIKLQYPFTWDGVSDLIVEFCYSKQADNSKDILVECTDMGYKCNAYGDGDGSVLQTKGCNLPFAGSSTLRPNMKFIIKPTFYAVGSINKDGERNAPAVSDLDGDNYPEMIIGSLSGGVRFFKGVKYVAPPPISVIENVELKSLIIYPNPAKEKITISWQDENVNSLDIKIYDLNGRLIINKNVRNRDVISTATLGSGLYILQLSNTGKIISYSKLVIVND